MSGSDVLARVATVPEAGCWLWMGGAYPSGYGRMTSGGKNRRAHRGVWELVNGPIPEGLAVCHKCDTPLCVNPDHLFLGSQAANVRDMAAKGRHRESKKATCPAGHPLVPENLTKRDDRRECLACKRARDRIGARIRRAALTKFQEGA